MEARRVSRMEGRRVSRMEGRRARSPVPGFVPLPAQVDVLVPQFLILQHWLPSWRRSLGLDRRATKLFLRFSPNLVLPAPSIVQVLDRPCQEVNSWCNWSKMCFPVQALPMPSLTLCRRQFSEVSVQKSNCHL